MIGDRAKQRRLELGWTQEDLARRMGYKSLTSINKIEMNKNDIPQKKIAKFARVLGVSIPYLLELENEKPERLFDLIVQLDAEDRARIEERVLMMLENEKYQ